MATITINGRRVKVDDSFLSLTPEQQNATVDEIAASFSTPGNVANPSRAFTDAMAGQSARGLKGKVSELPSNQPARPDFLTSAAATANGIAASVPFLQNVTDAIGGTVSQLTGGSYDQYVNRQKEIRDQLAATAPVARFSGELGGLLAGGSAMATTKLGKEALGLTGNFLPRVANSAMSGAGLSTLDALSRGEQGGDVLASAATGGVLSGLLPVVGAGFRLAGRQVKNSVIDPVATMLSPDNATTANLAKVIGADTKTGSVMSAADEAIAKAAGVPVINADRFGPATRRLARTASNIDDESKALFSRTIDDRFAGQTGRAENYVKQLMGGATDDLALKDRLRAAADKANGIGYAKAFNDPKAKAVWSVPISELMQSPTFRSAVDAAEGRAADRAAISGFKAVKNPFAFDEQGAARLRMKSDSARAAYAKAQEAYTANPTIQNARKLSDAQIDLNKVLEAGDGPVALPSLQFWDQVKRNLDGMIDAAKPTPLGGGDRTKYADLVAMKQKLVAALDSQVDSYKQTRSVAAEFFGADDAIDVGRKAFASTKNIPEQARVVAKMSAADKDAASVGYASELIDNIRASGDNRNLAIAQFFNSPAARARNELYLGATRAKQLEAYVKVENTVDMLRGAVKGNSTTAEQLIAAGAVGTGVGIATGDWQSGFTVGTLAALGMKGMKLAGKNVDEKVMRNVAEALLSTDPKMLERAIHNASMSKAYMDALEGLMEAAGLIARAGTMAAAS